LFEEPLVEEVIDFAHSQGVLASVGPAVEAADVWVTNDLRRAIEMCGGQGEHARFHLAGDLNTSDWGNSDLLGHNILTGENRTIGEVRTEELDWTRPDLTENLVAYRRSSQETCRSDSSPAV
jgi:hypothetical protein